MIRLDYGCSILNSLGSAPIMSKLMSKCGPVRFGRGLNPGATYRLVFVASPMEEYAVIQANRNCAGELVNDRMASAARVTPPAVWKDVRTCAACAAWGDIVVATRSPPMRRVRREGLL